MGKRAFSSKNESYGDRGLCTSDGKELESLIEWHFSEKRYKAIRRIESERLNGEIINEQYYKDRPSLIEALTPPSHNPEMYEIYSFIERYYHYASKLKLGGKVMVNPDMLKLKKIAKQYKIDIERYENYCSLFLNKTIIMEK